MSWFRDGRPKANDDELSKLVSQWRSAPVLPRQLSDDARARILTEAYSARDSVPVPAPLFSTFPRRLAATLVPAALALTVVAFFPDRTGDGSRPNPRVRIGKAGDEVVFTIANGSRGHTVYKSSDSSDFRDAERIAVEGGTFRDRVNDGPELVFYRID